MVPMNIQFVAEDQHGIWGDLAPKDLIDCGALADVAILDKGMQSGLPSVMFRVKLPDGRSVIAQQTARQMVTLGRMILVKYPKLFDEEE